ncbi:HNH endonuclease [Lactobacillus sp. PV037]|uniref:HNH endonuclease n=1 Tax=Lactobacillus sp. PV037 TaxID=2594496 RepID=UPI00223FEF46|nr:HNH endonuclease signature motif containing protein [Lactobacillus sp. PV037]QNQ83764.1 HNH endonuclease [Lactobacillus sp. PV037]
MSGRRYGHYNTRFYRSKEWKVLRKLALERDLYLCQECKKAGRITPAKIVHHIKPVRVSDDDKLKLENLETVCAACHNFLHPERAFNYKKKKTNIKNLKSQEIVNFKLNHELY